MPPKVKITKESIVKVAIDMVRSQGTSALNARSLAQALGCSTQPIFSNFDSMDDLKGAVVKEAERIYQAYSDTLVSQSEFPTYKASGMAYIRFAKEERELFCLLYMRNRSDEVIPEETDLGNQMNTLVQNNTGLCKDVAKLFHLEMWAYVHGIATMIATGYLDLDEALISDMLTHAFQGLKHAFSADV